MKPPPELDAIAGKVLAYEPERRAPLKVIVGASDKPLVIGNVEIPCYVLEDKTRVLSQGGFLQGIGRSRTSVRKSDVANLPSFLSDKNLSPLFPGTF